MHRRAVSKSKSEFSVAFAPFPRASPQGLALPPPRLIDITRYSQVQSQHFPHLSAGPTTEICTAGLLTYSSLLQHLPNLCERCSPAVSGLCRMIPCGRKLQQRVLSRTRRLLGFACINRDWRTSRTTKPKLLIKLFNGTFYSTAHCHNSQITPHRVPSSIASLTNAIPLQWQI